METMNLTPDDPAAQAFATGNAVNNNHPSIEKYEPPTCLEFVTTLLDDLARRGRLWQQAAGETNGRPGAEYPQANNGPAVPSDTGEAGAAADD